MAPLRPRKRPTSPSHRRVEITRGAGFGALLALLVMGLAPAAAHAELGSLGSTTIGIAIAAGFQPDSRSCNVGRDSHSIPVPGAASDACLMWAGGVEGLILWRGHIGVALGLYSVAGQAGIRQQQPGEAPPAFPDRVSVPLLLDMRPFSALGAAGGTGYLARFLHGIRFGLGPSFELVRTSSDSSVAWGERNGSPVKSVIGAQFSFDIEVPLHAAAASALSLRLSTRVLYVPLVTLDGDTVRSADFAVDATGAPTFLGYGTHAQAYLGFVYYL